MRKLIFVYLIVILMIAGLLFKDLVIGLFRGMTPLEAMKQIINFMLHVTVITIIGYALVSIGEIVKAFVKFGRWLIRLLGWRIGRRAARKKVAPTPARTRRTRLTDAERLLRLFIMAQQAQPPKRASRHDLPSDQNSQIKFY